MTKDIKEKFKRLLEELLKEKEVSMGFDKDWVYIYRTKSKNDFLKQIGEWGLNYKEKELAEWYRNLSEEERLSIEINYKISYHEKKLEELKNQLNL